MPSAASVAHLYRDGSRAYALTDEQINFTYPASSRPDFDYESEFERDTALENEKVIQDLVPEIVPDESYFQEEELPSIYGDENPMSSSPAEFIRNFLLI